MYNNKLELENVRYVDYDITLPSQNNVTLSNHANNSQNSFFERCKESFQTRRNELQTRRATRQDKMKSSDSGILVYLGLYIQDKFLSIREFFSIRIGFCIDIIKNLKPKPIKSEKDGDFDDFDDFDNSGDFGNSYDFDDSHLKNLKQVPLPMRERLTACVKLLLAAIESLAMCVMLLYGAFKVIFHGVNKTNPEDNTEFNNTEIKEKSTI